MSWENTLCLIKYISFLGSNNYFMNEINIHYKTDMPNDGTYVKRDAYTMKVLNFIGWHGQLSVLRKPIHTLWLAWSLWCYAPIQIHAQEKAGIHPSARNTKQKLVSDDWIMTICCHHYMPLHSSESSLLFWTCLRAVKLWPSVQCTCCYKTHVQGYIKPWKSDCIS